MKNLILAFTLLISFNTFSSEATDLYIAHAGCRVYEGRDLDNRPGIQEVEIWMYLDSEKPEYRDGNLSATLVAENSIETRKKCEELYRLYESGRKVRFEFEDKLERNASLRVKDFAAILTSNFGSRLATRNERGAQVDWAEDAETNEEDVIKNESGSRMR